MRDFIERLRAKPEQVRRRIAVGTTVAVTGVVTIAWVFAIVVSGDLTLAIPSAAVANNGTIAQATPQATTGIGQAFDQTSHSVTQLLGAVGMATATTAPASLTIVDSAPTSTPSEAQSDPTVIPF